METLAHECGCKLAHEDNVYHCQATCANTVETLSSWGSMAINSLKFTLAMKLQS